MVVTSGFSNPRTNKQPAGDRGVIDKKERPCYSLGKERKFLSLSFDCHAKGCWSFFPCIHSKVESKVELEIFPLFFNIIKI